MNKRKLYGTLIAVIAFAILVVGATFAWLTYAFNATNGLYNTSTYCFVTTGSNGQDINATLDYVTKPIDGVSTFIGMGMHFNCTVSTNGTIYLNVDSTTPNVLYSQVSPHCEKKDTLETLYNYTNSNDCTSNNGIWVTNGTALKYAIYDVNNPTNSTVPVKVGYITQNGDNILYEKTLMIVTKKYYIYFWLDGELADENYNNLSFMGYVHATATQNSEYINPPVIVDGLIPVKLSATGNTVTTVAANDPTWYDYNNKEWANAILVSDASRATYQGTTGVTVTSTDILAYYVWIPRYSYKPWAHGDGGVTDSGDPREIPIRFVSTNVKDDVVAIVSYNQWYTPSSFTFGDKELTGIWVGKFETSHETLSGDDVDDNTLGEDTGTTICNSTECDNYTGLRVLPNVQTILYNRIGNYFHASRFMESSGNPFGLLASSVDSHMMKNSEWGAVAYLSHSKYGINSEVRINNQNAYTTGCGALTESEARTANCDNAYGTVSVYPQSTTGNVTGIFDMSGGTFEYVMGHFGNTTTYGSYSGFDATHPLPDTKYYDNYSDATFTGTSNSTNFGYCNLQTCGGHALFETKGWYNDTAQFVVSNNPWFCRGGTNSNKTTAGIFSVRGRVGDTLDYTFRLVLTAE